MKILIDIGHPAHVHLFKHFAWEMQQKGHKIFFTARDKEHELYLLEKYKFQYVSFGKHRTTKIGKIFGLFIFDWKMFWLSLKIKPDIYLSHGSIYAAQISFLLRIPHISLEDTGNREQVRLYLPFTRNILTSDVFPFNYGKKQMRYKSHHEIAYLAPKYFIPDQNFKTKYKIEKDQKYAILRFVSWNATHDACQSGLSEETKTSLINTLSEKYKVFISSEGSLPDAYERYISSFSPEDLHDALYFADLFVGEGTTMAMEASILGTPSFYINSLQYANVKDLEQYGLLHSMQNDDILLEEISSFLTTPCLKEDLHRKKNILFGDKIDLTALLVWFIEKYPLSVEISNNNPDFLKKFTIDL